MEPCIAFVIPLVSFIPVYYILLPLQFKAAISDRTPIIWGLIGSCIIGCDIILIYIDGPANSFAILAYGPQSRTPGGSSVLHDTSAPLYALCG